LNLEVSSNQHIRLMGEHSMDGKLRAFGLRDLVAVVAIMVALIAIGIPTLAHPHRLNKRQTCAVDLKGIGTSAKIYANDNNERWMSRIKGAEYAVGSRKRN